MTTILCDRDIKRAVSLNGFKGLKIENSKNENIGPTFIHVRMSNDNVYSLSRGKIEPKNDSLEIYKGETISIETKESFIVPLNFVGTLHTRVWMAVKGLTIPNAILDPGYRGVLRIIITNHSGNRVTISTNDFIGKIMIFELSYKPEFSVDKQNNRGDILELHKNSLNLTQAIKKLRNRRSVAIIFLGLISIASVIIYFSTSNDKALLLFGVLIIFAQFLFFLIKEE